MRPVELFTFGGVDSRSNPINQPDDRCIRLRNFVPMKAGYLRLRDGYTPVSLGSSLPATPIHSQQSLNMLNGDRLHVLFQGTTPKTINLLTGAVTNPTIRGNAISSSNRWSYFFANNKLHAVNGTDKKFFDGTTWRDIGVRAPTDAEAAAVSVAIGSANTSALAASSVGGSQPGYQFYMAYYNPITGQVGNRVKIGARVAPSVASQIDITGLPNLSGEDSELVKLIGRTGDGAEVPYVVADASSNWVYVENGSTSATITAAGIDGNYELPTRNGLMPNLDKVVRVGERIYGGIANSPTIYKSTSELDAVTGKYLGRPEQSWPANNIETFPTGEPVTCVAFYSYELWAFSQNDLAILTELAGVPGWQGPWNGGCAGQNAFTKGWKGLPYWITGEKQLATMSAEGPTPISDEYETALLSRIGDQYLSQVEVRYIRDVQRQVDHLRIKCRDSNGNPFTVIHDFNLRDERSPYGQGYDEEFLGALSSDYTIEVLRDADGRTRMWAGAQDGKLYQLYSGSSDNGEEFTADAILLVYAGPNRTKINQLEWYGDSRVKWYVARDLNTSFPSSPDGAAGLDALHDDTVRCVPGDENSYHYLVDVTRPEIIHAYVWIRLTSHSEDAPNGMVLNDPPHFPLENYGRIFLVSPMLGSSRGAR